MIELTSSEKLIERLLVKKHRKENPRSRAVRLVRYCLNTSRRKQEECILCGEVGPSWCSEWPETKQATRWREEHIKMHVKSADVCKRELIYLSA